ncbi:MAG: WYL domain-containing protein [Syntrophaceae bacterium]
MSDQTIYERFFWFDERVKAKTYPNAAKLAERFEISSKTAQRAIEFMRDRLLAPLQYVAAERGYRYTDEAYELPGSWIGEEELTALLVAYRLASTIPDKKLKRSCATILKRILTRHGVGDAISMEDLEEKVSVKNIAYSRTDGRIFHQVLEHLLHIRPLAIEYYSPHRDVTTRRDILPQHLLHYMGTWHIIAHCGLKNDLRDFVVSRIKSLKASERELAPRFSAAQVKAYIRRNFGIMNSPEATMVCLRFTPQTAPWVAEQVWHPAQEAVREPDGALTLTFPVADFREIKREILKHGAQVEVLAPASLRQEVMVEIKKMAGLYL